MRCSWRTIASLCLLTGLLAGVAATASAAGANPVADCNTHGTLTQQYTPAQLRNGISTMPADIREYTDCYDVLQRALLADLGQAPSGAASSTSSGSGGSFLPAGVIIVIVLLILVAATFGAIALRRRRAAGPGGPGPDGPGGGPGPDPPAPGAP